MSYTDDYASSIAPFAGDQTGQILAEPDVVSLSPVTSARVVETQSGYLVVVKRADDRLSLSVKRRIGTPPSSQVILTCDETVGLSRILCDSAAALGYSEEFTVRENGNKDHAATQDDLGTIYGDAAPPDAALDWDEIKKPLRYRRTKKHVDSIAETLADVVAPSRLKKIPIVMIGAGAAAVIGLVVVAFLAVTFLTPSKSSTSSSAAKPAASVNPMSADNVDKFVRNFVGNMLDFNPKTYRGSQVHAMAVMKSSLMERYWHETGFPISTAKLKSQHRDQTLIINKVVQQPSSSVTTDIDMYAEVVTPGEESTAIHLLMELGLNDEGNLLVTEMKDAATSQEEKSTEPEVKSSAQEEKSTEQAEEPNE